MHVLLSEAEGGCCWPTVLMIQNYGITIYRSYDVRFLSFPARARRTTCQYEVQIERCDENEGMNRQGKTAWGTLWVHNLLNPVPSPPKALNIRSNSLSLIRDGPEGTQS